MFGVDRSHVAQGRGDPAGKAKPYSGPTDPVGWLATAARHALSHHHPESFAPHVVFPPYLLVKVCGPKRAVAVATGAAAGRAAFAAAAARGLALSLCYVMHADWFNDVCDVDVDAKNKPERPLPSGACSRAQGLLVAAFYGCLGLGVTRTPPEPALRRAYAAAFAAMGAAAFLYSDDRLPTRRLARRAPLGRALAFCGIYAAFDALMYVEACDALGLAPAPFAANPLFGAFLWAAAATVPWNLALLVAKDLGDVPGDAAAGLRTLPAALPDDRSAGCLVLALPGPEWKYRVDLREPPRHAIEQTRSRGQRRVDGVGRPKFDFHTGPDHDPRPVDPDPRRYLTVRISALLRALRGAVFTHLQQAQILRHRGSPHSLCPCSPRCLCGIVSAWSSPRHFPCEVLASTAVRHFCRPAGASSPPVTSSHAHQDSYTSASNPTASQLAMQLRAQFEDTWNDVSPICPVSPPQGCRRDMPRAGGRYILRHRQCR